MNDFITCFLYVAVYYFRLPLIIRNRLRNTATDQPTECNYKRRGSPDLKRPVIYGVEILGNSDTRLKI